MLAYFVSKEKKRHSLNCNYWATNSINYHGYVTLVSKYLLLFFCCNNLKLYTALRNMYCKKTVLCTKTNNNKKRNKETANNKILLKVRKVTVYACA